MHQSSTSLVDAMQNPPIDHDWWAQLCSELEDRPNGHPTPEPCIPMEGESHLFFYIPSIYKFKLSVESILLALALEIGYCA